MGGDPGEVVEVKRWGGVDGVKKERREARGGCGAHCAARREDLGQLGRAVRVAADNEAEAV